MTFMQAVILGLVEGITEYLPVSSTGHLILAERLVGIGASDQANAYAICIQAGAIAAVLLLYFHRVRVMAASLVDGNDQGRCLLINLIAAFLPAAVIGLLLDTPIERYLFGVWPVVAAWFVGGVAILVVAHWQRRRPRPGMDLEALTWRSALIIGSAQALALWPGTSRSLVTIVGGLLVGLSMPAAVEFSFLLGMLTLGAATAYKGLQHGAAMLSVYGWAGPGVGFVVAAVSAGAAVRWMVKYLTRHGLEIFGYYRLLIALIAGGLLLAGVL